MKLYIYDKYISTDEDKMNDKIFDILCTQYKDIAMVENRMDYEWDNVDEEDISVYEITKYIDNGYEML